MTTEGNCNKGNTRLGLASTSGSTELTGTTGCGAVLTLYLQKHNQSFYPLFRPYFCNPACLTALFAAAWLAFKAASTVIFPASAPATFCPTTVPKD